MPLEEVLRGDRADLCAECSGCTPYVEGSNHVRGHNFALRATFSKILDAMER